MTADDAITLAINAIGTQERSDYIISPTSHAEQLGSKAPELAAILSSTKVGISATQYEEEDKEALDAQNKFRRASNRANLMVFVTTILTGLVLAIATIASLLPDTIEQALLVALGLATVFCGAIATRDLVAIRNGNLLEDWMSKRAAAETYRLVYFETVVGSAAADRPATQSGIPIDLLKLEYFRRFQLDVQRNYYRERAKQHRAEAAKTLSYGSLAVAGAALATGTAGVLSVLNAQFAAIAALGTIFAGLSSYSAIRESVHQDRRNAERYVRTSRVLEEITKRLDDVRKAVYASGSEPLDKFVKAVDEQLSLEHRQWLGDQSLAQGALGELQRILKDASTGASKPTNVEGG